MKKRWIWIPITILLVLMTIVVKRYTSREPSVIAERITSLDLEKITACTVEWMTLDDKYYSYMETDRQKVQAMYEAVSHMKLKEERYDPLLGASYYGLSFMQDGEEISIFSYYDGHVLAPGLDKYAAEITNEEELEEAYGWISILLDMIGASKK